MKASEFFDLNKSIADRLLFKCEYPWEALDMLSEYISRIARRLDREIYEEIKRGVWIARSAKISESARLSAPLIIGEGSEVGRLVSLGGAVIVGNGAVIGDFSEVKCSILFDGARVSQNNYISDSILGYKSGFGTGAIVSSLSADRRGIVCNFGDVSVCCERGRFGAVIGDGAEIGCSSVISAGTIVEKGARVGPLTRVGGFVSRFGEYSRVGEKIISDIL